MFSKMLSAAFVLGLVLPGAPVGTSPSSDCCALGLDCCPDGSCCGGAKVTAQAREADCCADSLPSCVPPSACCGDQTSASASCCAADATCCPGPCCLDGTCCPDGVCCPDGSCCAAAKGAKGKVSGCCTTPSRVACCAK
jgi:hypothetical protein